MLHDAKFEIADCCAVHASATITMMNGLHVGLLRGALGYFSVAVYAPDGSLIGRCGGVDDQAAELLLERLQQGEDPALVIEQF